MNSETEPCSPWARFWRIKRLAIGAGKDKDLSLVLFLATHGFGEPVQVDGVNVLCQFDNQTGLTGQQVPLEDLVVLAARVQLICCGPADATHKFFM